MSAGGVARPRGLGAAVLEERTWAEPLDELRPGLLFYQLNPEYSANLQRVIAEVEALGLPRVIPAGVLAEQIIGHGIAPWNLPWALAMIVEVAECTSRWVILDRPPSPAYPAAWVDIDVIIVPPSSGWGLSASLAEVLDAARALEPGNMAFLVKILADEIAEEAS